jgi:hypothetical protein
VGGLRRGLFAVVIVIASTLLLSACAARTTVAPTMNSGPTGERPPNARITYVNKPNTPYEGLPPSMDTGQPINYSPSTDAMQPFISNGALTLARGFSGGPGGWYAFLDAGAGNTLNRVGVRLHLNNAGASTNGEAVTLALTNDPDIQANGLYGIAYRMGLHFVLMDSRWAATKVSNATGTLVFTTLSSGFLKESLKSDGTQYRVEVSRTGATANVTLPDGQHVAVSDPDIANWSGQYGFFEASLKFDKTDVLPCITDAWYESGPR